MVSQEISKPYTWEEIKDFLVKELKKTNHIMTFGTIGSCKVEHDIDIIITKKPQSKTSDFYREIHNIFENLNRYLLNKYDAKAIRFSNMIEESFLVFLKKYRDKDIGLHVMIYTSFPQIKLDWSGAQDVDFKKLFTKNHDYLIGSSKDIFSKLFGLRRFYDATYNFLQYADMINSHYPKKLFLDYMNKMFNYIPKKRLGLEPMRAMSEKKIKEIFYSLCDKLDELEKSK